MKDVRLSVREMILLVDPSMMLVEEVRTIVAFKVNSDAMLSRRTCNTYQLSSSLQSTH